MDAAAVASSRELVETEAAAATSLVRNPCSFAEMENILELDTNLREDWTLTHSKKKWNWDADAKIRRLGWLA